MPGVFSTQRVSQVAGRAIYAWDDVNNREQLIYGDTGWRDVTTLLVKGWTSTLLQLRRVGLQCTLTGVINGSSATSDHFLTLINNSGFIPTPAAINVPVVADDYSAYRDLNYDGVSTVKELYIRAAPVGKTWRIGASWYTGDAWPTTLPGAAVGIVPYT